MSIRQGNNIIAGTPDASSVKIDNITLTENQAGDTQAVALVDRNTGYVKTWTGTQAEYDAIEVKDLDTLYNVEGDLYEDVYPPQAGNTGKFLSTDGENVSWQYAVGMRAITNCITEIPQDIKLELADGTLTLKAGSKVYIPNGFEADGVTPKFDVVTIASDVSWGSSSTSWSSTKWLVRRPDDTLFVNNGDYTSGSTYSGGTYGIWYDTTNNAVKYTSDGGSTWISGYSLPLAQITVASGTGATSIDQVFNGFGYIGSTVFALPGVKGLIPNGRNADGSLKNTEFVNDKVLTYTNPNKYIKKYIVTFDLLKRLRIYENVYYGYDEYKNIHIDTYSNKEVTNIPVASILTDSNGVITSFSPKIAFHAVDYNDSSWVSAQAMPSGKYIDLTLGASGSTYTAPANGWFVIDSLSGAANGTLGFYNKQSKVRYSTYAYTKGYGMALSCPVPKGEIVTIVYTNITSVSMYFVYAEGEN